MPAASQKQDSAKRKTGPNTSKDADPKKRTRSQDPQLPISALIAPHEAILAELESKYDVLAASIISSTHISKRITHVVSHLVGESEQPRAVLLHARTADVCKLITVVEKCKRVLGEEGKACWQYNQLFDLPEKPKKREIIEETVLGKGVQDDDSDSDDFEVMHSRFEDAVLPRPSARSVKSMRVFLSIAPIPELKSKKGVTVQSGAGKGNA
ncbi:DNA RNA-binding Alba [Fusarium albosuccineum]|uniref:DNA RNA-binding Alba n=1 Tax=Fusarium albosuccineum TaxID=1237068 RepID=A0A8H4PCV9_9HYPO|nr:DNA RNA-binding Alba [Fusarium albosuccineum]